MKIDNPFQMNDWEIKKFLNVVLAIQLAVWGLIGLDAINIQLPIIRPLMGFIYLTFVPGILILRILKLHKLGNIKTTLYTIGLSLTILMFTGLFINSVYLFFDVSGPVSLIPLIITMSIVLLILCIISYVRDKDFADPSFINAQEILSPSVLFLCLIPPMAVFGTYIVNFHHNNIILMLMIIMIAFVALMIGFDKFIPTKLYPLAIWVIAISLIFHDTLISMYPNKYDVIGEYYFSKLVVIGSYWDWTIPSNNNAMLSTTMLAPIYTYILNIELTWVFKIIYPLIFSIYSLGVYIISKMIFNKKMAFLSTFYFISLNTFYCVIPSICKQLIAECFFILFLLLILYENVDKLKKSFLMILMSASMIVSHYGISYLVMFSLIFISTSLFIIENKTVRGVLRDIHSIFKKDVRVTNGINTKHKAVSLNFLFLFISITIAWYVYVSSSSAFNTILHITDHISNTLFAEFFNPEYSRGAHTLAAVPESPIGWINKIVKWSAVLFIIIGILELLFLNNKIKFEKHYIGFSIYWFIICMLSIAISGFAVMNPSRLYHISLIILAPVAVIGGITAFEAIMRILHEPKRNKSINKPLKMLYIFFIIFLLLNTGFIFEIAKDHPSSISLSQDSVKKHGDIEDIAAIFMNTMHEQDVFSAGWIFQGMKRGERIYVTMGNGEGTHALNYNMVSIQTMNMLSNKTKEINEGSYIYMSYLNNVERIGLGFNAKIGCPIYFNMTDISPLLANNGKIYDNGGSEILWS